MNPSEPYDGDAVRAALTRKIVPAQQRDVGEPTAPAWPPAYKQDRSDVSGLTMGDVTFPPGSNFSPVEVAAYFNAHTKLGAVATSTGVVKSTFKPKVWAMQSLYRPKRR